MDHSLEEPTAKRHLPPVTECFLCNRAFNDPRVLECIHTFCTQCLEDYCKTEGRQVVGRFPCPICKKEQKIPDGGIKLLRKNTFIEHLLEIQKLETLEAGNVLCQVCDFDETAPAHASNLNRATKYCLDCRQYHCNRCSKHHTKQRFSQTHETVELGKQVSKDTMQRVKTYCDTHKDKQVEFYCHDCRITFCMSCYVVRHNGHNACDIAEVSKEFYSNVEVDIGRITNITAECQKEANRLDALKTKFMDSINKVETKIRGDADMLRRFVDEQEAAILGDLSKIQEANEERIRRRMQDINQHIIMLDSFKQYIMEVKEKATPADVSRTGCSLHDRANELHAIPYDVDFVLDQIHYKSEDFPSKHPMTSNNVNLVGCVSVKPQLAEGEAPPGDGSNQDQNMSSEDELIYDCEDQLLYIKV